MEQRQIKLEPVLVLGSKSTFAIIDQTDDIHRKRGTITVDYSPADIRKLMSEGLDYDAMLSHYEDKIYGLVKYYIAGDWKSVDDNEEVMAIVSKHVGLQLGKLDPEHNQA
ncbi:MAG: hypothetical protein Q4B78_02050 [Bacillota bacterium]|nr:hypothetical protein [Bacillota bacterium]